MSVRACVLRSRDGRIYDNLHEFAYPSLVTTYGNDSVLSVACPFSTHTSMDIGKLKWNIVTNGTGEER